MYCVPPYEILWSGRSGHGDSAPLSKVSFGSQGAYSMEFIIVIIVIIIIIIIILTLPYCL